MSSSILIHFSCLSTKMILNIFHFQGRLLEEIQISQSPAQAPSLEHKEASKTQELFSSFMLNLLQHQAVRK